jgi:bifunctional UDP-N-acetylglucosamine pyrophosphorylase/glucosamine-1-phosphate N-acetyltransferase
LKLTTIILAAGEGKRMKSALPKVLHRLAGKPLLGHVLEACEKLGATRRLVVVGKGREAVEEWLDGRAEIAHQTEQLGTGHAVMVAEPLLGDETEAVFVLSGDTPLITVETLQGVVDQFKESDPAAVMVTAEMDDPTGYGRVIRDETGAVVGIVEEKDTDSAERAVKEINTGIYCFDKERLFAALKMIGNDNKQGEYYLTDVISALRREGGAIVASPAAPDEVMGVNSRADLAEAERVMQARLKRRFMDQGVTFILPETTYLETDVEIARDAVIMPQCYLEAGTRIETGVKIGPGVRTINSRIGAGAEISYAVLRDCEIEENVSVGPYCSLRPGATLRAGAKAGTFVEIKKSDVGAGSKVPHLSYIGDAEIGVDVNIGAGSITCNYDGAQKHKTVIEDGVFLGSDTMMIAPIRIGKGSSTGAGSSISHDVPPDSLAIERTEQRTIAGWAKRRRAKRK